MKKMFRFCFAEISSKPDSRMLVGRKYFGFIWNFFYSKKNPLSLLIPRPKPPVTYARMSFEEPKKKKFTPKKSSSFQRKKN